MQFLSVIIPAFNESENLAEMIWRTEASLKGRGHEFEILVVDDNSPDGTAIVGENLSKFYRNVRIINRLTRFGLASAILQGMKAARGDLFVVMDADLQHPPEQLPSMIDEIERGCDLVVMSRYLDGGATEHWSIVRKFMSKVAIFLTHMVLSKTKSIADPISGYFMVKACAIRGVELKPDGFKILPEILDKGRLANIKEIAYTFTGRKRGESKLGLGEATKYLMYLTLLALFSRNHRSQLLAHREVTVN